MSDTNKHSKYDLDSKPKALLNLSQISWAHGEKFITMMTEKKRWDVHARWWAMVIFQLTELYVKVNSPGFQYARARGRSKWRHQLWAERMRDANVRNHPRCFRPIVVLSSTIIPSTDSCRRDNGNFSKVRRLKFPFFPVSKRVLVHNLSLHGKMSLFARQWNCTKISSELALKQR